MAALRQVSRREIIGWVARLDRASAVAQHGGRDPRHYHIHAVTSAVTHDTHTRHADMCVKQCSLGSYFR